MTIKKQARYLDGSDVGRTVGPFTRHQLGGLNPETTGGTIDGVMHFKGGVGISLTCDAEDSLALYVDPAALLDITGATS